MDRTKQGWPERRAVIVVLVRATDRVHSHLGLRYPQDPSPFKVTVGCQTARGWTSRFERAQLT